MRTPIYLADSAAAVPSIHILFVFIFGICLNALLVRLGEHPRTINLIDCPDYRSRYLEDEEMVAISSVPSKKCSGRLGFARNGHAATVLLYNWPLPFCDAKPVFLVTHANVRAIAKEHHV